jgi:hypothetical protein
MYISQTTKGERLPPHFLKSDDPSDGLLCPSATSHSFHGLAPQVFDSFLRQTSAKLFRDFKHNLVDLIQR